MTIQTHDSSPVNTPGAERRLKTVDSNLLPQHLTFLETSAVDIDVAVAAGCCSIEDLADLPEEFGYLPHDQVPGLIFPWHPVDQSFPTVLQYRPDKPQVVEGRPLKYLFPKGQNAPLSVHPIMRDRLPHAPTIVIVEGTKQYLAAVSVFRSDPTVAVAGIPGCWGWSKEGSPAQDFFSMPWSGKDVVVMFDADWQSNQQVWDAANSLAMNLTTLLEVKAVRFATLPGGYQHGEDKRGVDDFLAGLPVDRREGALRSVVQKATAKIGRRPIMQHRFLMGNRVKSEEVAQQIVGEHPLALDAKGAICAYQNGVYRSTNVYVCDRTTTLLGDLYTRKALGEVEDHTARILRVNDRLIIPRTSPLFIVKNGMFDLKRDMLLPHSPDYFAAEQYPAVWEPSAAAPAYEQAMRDQVGDDLEALEEVASQILEWDTYPEKAIFIYGPTRSGKSTFLRVLQRIVGAENTASVTLHQLATDKFATADLYGKSLNLVGDMTLAQVEDIARFKELTGGDLVRAERKYGQPFAFRNHAMFVFAGNAIPPMSEGSGALAARMMPFKFPNSFLGEEDPRIEQAIAEETSGILNRFIAAAQRRRARGHFLPINPRVLCEFEVATDPVAAFLSERTTHCDKGTPTTEVYRLYRDYAQDNGFKPLNSQNFGQRVIKFGYERVHRNSGDVFLLRFHHGNQPPLLLGDGSDDLFEKNPETQHKESESQTVDAKKFSEKHVTSITGMVLDLETADANRLYTYQTHDEQGFVRLAATSDRVTTDISTVVRQLEAADRVIGHNLLNYDLLALARHRGLDYRKVAEKSHDTLILARLTDPPEGGMKANQRARAYSLDALAQQHGIDAKGDALPRLKEQFGGYDRIPLDNKEYAEYAGTDARIAAQLAERYPMTQYGQREHRVLAIAGQISLRGFRIDEIELARQEKAGREAALKAQHFLRDLGLPQQRKGGGVSTSPWATDAGKEFLDEKFASYGIQLPRSDSGTPKMDRETLEELTASLPADHPAAVLRQQLRICTQRTLVDQIKVNRVDDRVHSLITADQATGRWSFREPGLTTAGKRGDNVAQRQLFIPDEGHVMLIADLSQIDARSVAVQCQDPRYLDLFEPGVDAYLQVAAEIWGDPSKRDQAKVLVHATNYGAGTSTLAHRTGLTEGYIHAFRRKMQTTYPAWFRWRREVADQVRAGELLDNGFGRKLRVHRDRATTAGPAAIGQSCSRDLMMEGLLRMDDAGLTPYLRCLVHDEVVLSVPKDSYDDIARTVLECLQFEWGIGSGRPIQVVATVGKPGNNWADAYMKSPNV